MTSELLSLSGTITTGCSPPCVALPAPPVPGGPPDVGVAARVDLDVELVDPAEHDRHQLLAGRHEQLVRVGVGDDGGLGLDARHVGAAAARGSARSAAASAS